MNASFPTDHHMAAVEHMLDGYRADGTVRGALLCGSLARGTARTDSDIDILVVLQAEPDEPTRRTQCGEVDVEETRRTYEGWVERFSPSRVGDESWGYAFLDGMALPGFKGSSQQSGCSHPTPTKNLSTTDRRESRPKAAHPTQSGMEPVRNHPRPPDPTIGSPERSRAWM